MVNPLLECDIVSCPLNVGRKTTTTFHLALDVVEQSELTEVKNKRQISLDVKNNSYCGK